MHTVRAGAMILGRRFTRRSAGSAFAAEHRDRVHACGPAGGNQCREQAHERHRDAGRGERDRVERGDLEEEWFA